MLFIWVVTVSLLLCFLKRWNKLRVFLRNQSSQVLTTILQRQPLDHSAYSCQFDWITILIRKDLGLLWWTVKSLLKVLTASRRLLSCSIRRSSARLSVADTDAIGDWLLVCGDAFISSTRPLTWSMCVFLMGIKEQSWVHCDLKRVLCELTFHC